MAKVRSSQLTVAGSHSSLHTNRDRVFGSDLEPDRSKDKAKPSGIRARPVEVNRDEARKRQVRMQYNNGGLGQPSRSKHTTATGSGKRGGERPCSRDEFRYAMRRGAAERLALVQRMKHMELELMVAKQRNAQQEQQLLRLAAVQNGVPTEQQPPTSGATAATSSPILLDPRIRRSTETGHSRASLACEVERELLMLALAAEKQLAVDGGGSPQSAAVRGYAAMVSQLSDEFHAEMRKVLDAPHSPAAAAVAANTEQDQDSVVEVRYFLCIHLWPPKRNLL